MRIISVIIPTFNRASLLERALDSVLSQTYSNWELIVVDDGSTDRTADVVSDWSARVEIKQKLQFLKLPTNQGVSAARNHGAEAATGEWLAFLDSDDEWLPDRLSSQFGLVASRPDLRWVHGEEIWVRNGRAVPVAPRYRKHGGFIFDRCVDVCCVGTSTVLIGRELFLRAGGFRPKFVVCEDYDLWLRVAAEHEIGLVAEPIVRKHGGHPDQLSMKYIGMDYYRALALETQLKNSQLSSSQREKVAMALAEKRRILEAGSAKHGRSAKILWERKSGSPCRTDCDDSPLA